MYRKLTSILVAVSLSALSVSGAAFAGAAEGKDDYVANCSSCHGESGAGDGPVGAALNPKPRDFTTGDFKFDTDGDGKAGSDADLKAVIEKGAMAFGGSPLMVGWVALSPEQISNIIAYIRTLKK